METPELFDHLDTALSKGRRTLGRRWRRSLPLLLIPVIAYVSSIITISVVYFGRSGQLNFQANSFTDWLIAFVVVLLALAGIWQISRELRIEKGILVNRDELGDVMMLARNDASQSVVTIAGDLSWLEEDRTLLLELRNRKPAVDFKIYYDKTRTVRLRDTINQLADSGIKFIPYPLGFRPSFKCTLIDGGKDEEKRVCATWREGPKLTGQARSRQVFHWKEYSAEHKLIPKAINNFTELIDSLPARPILVGITGVNNVGKTTFANSLLNGLGESFAVHLFEDPFREHVGGTSIYDNFRILVFQLLLYCTRPSAQIYLFDTTVAESVCYIWLRGATQGKRTYQDLVHSCAQFMKNFDMIVEVKKDVDDVGLDTTHVTGQDRKEVEEKLTEFYRRGIVRQKVTLRASEWDKSLAAESEKIQKRICELLDPRNRH